MAKHFVRHGLRCPHCGRSASGATNARPGDDAAIVAGDAAICAYCNGINIYEGDPLTLRAATAEEIGEIKADAAAAGLSLKVVRKN